MTPLQVGKFAAALRRFVPELIITSDAGKEGGQSVWIDMRLGERFSAISWSAFDGFGFYDETAPGYGHEAPIVTIEDPEEAAEHQARVLEQMGWPVQNVPRLQGPTVDERISYDKVAVLDLDDLAHIPDEALADHFRETADKALTSQLKRFLDGANAALLGVDDDVERPVLTQRYVSRRVSVIIELRKARADFDKALGDALGRITD